MRWFHLLPRLLLCLLLVVDGVGGAMAAVHVHSAAAATTAVAAGATPRSAMDDCSDRHAIPAASNAADGADPPGTTPATDGHDCCSDAGASCPCPGGNVSAITADGFVPAGGPPVTLAVHPLRPGHAAPRLPGPIRPPIV